MLRFQRESAPARGGWGEWGGPQRSVKAFMNTQKPVTIKAESRGLWVICCRRPPRTEEKVERSDENVYLHSETSGGGRRLVLTRGHQPTPPPLPHPGVSDGEAEEERGGGGRLVQHAEEASTLLHARRSMGASQSTRAHTHTHTSESIRHTRAL